MDKKDIYDHLAKVYLGSATPAKSKSVEAQVEPIRSKTEEHGIYFFVGVAALIIIFALFSLSTIFKHKPIDSQSYLVLASDPIKISFNFDPAKKQIYSLNLDKLNLSTYKSLSFSIKKNNAKNPISMRVEVESKFKEKSEVYIKDIPAQWKDFDVKLNEFKKISNWDNVSNISFVVEEWNSKDNQGTLYIDNLKLLK